MAKEQGLDWPVLGQPAEVRKSREFAQDPLDTLRTLGTFRTINWFLEGLRSAIFLCRFTGSRCTRSGGQGNLSAAAVSDDCKQGTTPGAGGLAESMAQAKV